jgi:hypothetical protein
VNNFKCANTGKSIPLGKTIAISSKAKSHTKTDDQSNTCVTDNTGQAQERRYCEWAQQSKKDGHETGTNKGGLLQTLKGLLFKNMFSGVRFEIRFIRPLKLVIKM